VGALQLKIELTPLMLTNLLFTRCRSDEGDIHILKLRFGGILNQFKFVLLQLQFRTG